MKPKREGDESPLFNLKKIMKTIHQAIREHMKVPFTEDILVTEEQLKCQWVPEFERLMRNRLMIGGLRYGLIDSRQSGIAKNCDSAIKRIHKYLASGNTEFLVDAANLLMIEFKNGLHPKKHFHAIDDGEHTKKLI